MTHVGDNSPDVSLQRSIWPCGRRIILAVAALTYTSVAQAGQCPDPCQVSPCCMGCPWYGTCACPNGPVCDDGIACTTDYCSFEGTPHCAADPIQCLPPPCHSGGCVNGECVYTWTCPDPPPCGSVWCANGSCTTFVNCADNNPCTTDECVNGVCVHDTNCAADEDPCTFDWMDENCGCHHDPITCQDVPCTTHYCQDGQCVYESTCPPSQDPCIVTTCVNGNCSSEPRDCSDDNPCTFNEHCDPQTGNCVADWNCDPPQDPCLQRWCNAQGGCETIPVNCDDNNPCTTDPPCDPELGCVHEWTCEDYDPCTVEACFNGQCVQQPLCPPDTVCYNVCCLQNGQTASCGVDHYAQPCAIQGLPTAPVSVCPGYDKTLNGTFCNTGSCPEQYAGSVQITGAAAPYLMVIFTPPAPAAGGCTGLTVTIDVAANAVPGTSAQVYLKATSTSDGTCQAVQEVSCDWTINVTIAGIDLDVDSDHDGDIDLSDDAIEEQFPGKWGWINNDDDNMDMAEDIANNVIDGAGDLVDVGELIVQPVPAGLAADPHLYLSVDTPGVIRIFESRQDGSAGIIAPGVGISAEITTHLGGHTFGMEGLTSGSTIVRLTLKDGETTVCDDVVMVTVVRVLSVEWDESAAYSQPLDTCPNNGGQRVYPDRRYIVDPNQADRNKVALVATVTPSIEGFPVRLRIWDVDDPFDQNNPALPGVAAIDSDHAGPDNKLPPGVADPAVAQWSQPTDALGKSRIVAILSMQPGNNYRAGASAMADGIDEIYPALTQTYADTYNPPGVPAPSPLALTGMLTVWRRVWLELDSMAAGTDIGYTGNIDAIANNTPHAGDGTVELDVPEIDDNGRFEGGVLSVAATGSAYTLIDNIDVGGDDDYTASALIAAPDEDNSGAVTDDDTAVLPRTPDPDTANRFGVLNAKYRNCYMTFTHNPATHDITNAFQATLSTMSSAIAAKGAENKDLNPAADLWVVLIVACYQSYGPNDVTDAPLSTSDADPDLRYHIHGPSWSTGDTFLIQAATAGGGPNVTAFYLETNLDSINQTNAGYMPFPGPAHPLSWREPRIIAHEIAHQCGIVPHTPGTLVSNWDEGDYELNGSQLRDIRMSQDLGN